MYSEVRVSREAEAGSEESPGYSERTAAICFPLDKNIGMPERNHVIRV
jgi:hypothetical protein